MPISIINSEEEKDEYIQIWKYLSANGKLFIPVYNSADLSAVYVEEEVEGKKTIRAFIENEAIQVYMVERQDFHQDEPDFVLKIGVAPVKLLQKKLIEVYGKESKDGIIVECLLTSYDDMGNIKDIDTIWTQASN
jgi:hypothetical protein